MRQFQVQVCVLFDRPYSQEELFDEPIPFSEETSEEEETALTDQPLIGFYTTRYVSAQTVAEAVHYVEEEINEEEDLPSRRIYDVSCTEIHAEELDQEIRKEARNPDVPGVWYEEGLGFFSEIEVEQPHSH